MGQQLNFDTILEKYSHLLIPDLRYNRVISCHGLKQPGPSFLTNGQPDLAIFGTNGTNHIHVPCSKHGNTGARGP